ncbi:MAG: hypothetical protein NZ853_10585 [Leptospiraceae bacterium]|nr:hypothetical protein [Leptospiraceae bacterium]MDW7977101.1 hypothetical protein [Leptospiraceae bacterium]
MNEKTAKLLNKYAMAKGLNPKNLKRFWLSLNKEQRFLERQKILKELLELHKKKS